MNNNDFLFASLMGGKAVATLESNKVFDNQFTKQVLPPIPFLPFQNVTGITAVSSPVIANHWSANQPLDQKQQYFPLLFSFSENGARWLFPFEPLISVSGGNAIIKRKVAKRVTGGTIKERWAQNDYEITITGVLFGAIERGNYEDTYPRVLMRELFDFLKKAGFIYVFSDLLNTLGILNIVIEDYNFPFTKGENVQAFEIKASSDMGYKLLTELIEP
ncbi:DUF6046 domain-containing protein [Flavobacterium sandaracinum]|uniref:DUF6046 domain-containing protein n=1 Tax=Flavobacterium sandaracinum TaxID=2541733 RepID=A0A4R5CUT1_9FLAO|nr:DUF6046 domain-containing protein [Flavobacterium sandaracinum]TDE01523.1 hypothetical protein E0F91_14305 [Flavobacterium sandaracinum]